MMSSKRDWLIAGLGNPGKHYQNTRHNLGFMVVNKISESYGIPLKKKSLMPNSEKA